MNETRCCRDCSADLSSRPYAQYCDDCRWRHRGKPRKYQWTPERDAYLRAQYSSLERHCGDRIGRIWGWPAWVVRRRATELGLTQPTWTSTRKAWTADEDRLLTKYAGSRHPNWIARRLQRSLTSVVVRMKRQGLSRLPDGYSLLQVAAGFGVERGSVERWHRQGWLPHHFQLQDGQPYRFTEADLLAFIHGHRTAFDLRKVDAMWFLSLVLDTNSSTQRVA